MSYSCLNITEQQFDEIYQGTSVHNYKHLFFTAPKDEQDLFENYLPSKLWRLNNIYTIVNKYGDLVRYRMNLAQHKVHAASLRHPRLIILKSRQQGISTHWLVDFFDDCVCYHNFSIGLMAQGLDESETLLERIITLWDWLDQDIKDHLGVTIKVNNSKEFSLSNKSKIFVRTSFRSTTLQRLHISEMGKIANKNPDKAKETKTGTLQALAQGNKGIVESTAEGENMFKDMWDNAVTNIHLLSPKDFYPVFLSWLDDPDCNIEIDQPISTKAQKYFDTIEKDLGIKLTRTQKNFWIAQYRELGDRIFQEYPTTSVEAFMATKDGAYYAKLYLENVIAFKREVPNLYDKNLSVQLSIDLGMNDTNSLCAAQWYNHLRIIDEFADHGQKISYYTDWIKSRPWFPNLTHVILPHDAEVKDLTSGETRTEVFARELKYDLDGNETNITITVLPKIDRNEGIEQVRQLIPMLWVDTTIEYLRYCLLNYKKEWDEKRERWRDKPEHDEASNGADSIRYMAMGVDKGSTFKAKPQTLTKVAYARSRQRGDIDV